MESRRSLRDEDQVDSPNWRVGEAVASANAPESEQGGPRRWVVGRGLGDGFEGTQGRSGTFEEGLEQARNDVDAGKTRRQAAIPSAAGTRNLDGKEGIGSPLARRGFKAKLHAMLRFARAHDTLRADA